MIINSLYRYYQLLSEQPNSDISSTGFSVAKVAFAFVISDEGELQNVVPLAEQKGKKQIALELEVPEQAKRSSGISPNFLCDNCTYMVGMDAKGKPDRAKKAFEASKELHFSILDGVDDPGARAILNYFAKWDVKKDKEHLALSPMLEDLLTGGNIVFRLDGELGYIHERAKIKAAWLRHSDKTRSEVVGQCLVSGEIGPISRLHPSIKGVRGAQSSGASLVSFNLNAFTSYGKTQSYNAPVSEEVTFGYTTVLNYLLSSRRQRVQLDPNTTVVFWSERKGCFWYSENRAVRNLKSRA